MRTAIACLSSLLFLLPACGGDDPSEDDAGQGGQAHGGHAAGGHATGGQAVGGSQAAGGHGGAGGGLGANINRISCEGVTPKRSLLTPDQLLGMLDKKDFALINVHVPNAGQITGTDTHISYLEPDNLEAYLGADKGIKAVVYCLTGPMSKIASDELVKRGYCQIYDMPAGAYEWQRLNYPYEK